MSITKFAKLFKPNQPSFGLSDEEGLINKQCLNQLNHADGIAWRQKDLALLYTCIENNRRCYLNYEGTNGSFQTLLLATDLPNEQLIIDDCFPALPSAWSDQEATLILRQDNSYANLRVRVRLTHRTSFRGREAYIARIYAHQWHTDRRDSGRMVFARDQAPRITLTIPMLSQLNGHIHNLSVGGAQASITGKVPKPYELGTLDNTPPVDCSMNLANHLSIKCRAYLRSYRLERQPCLQAQLRLSFKDLSDSDRSMLYTLVELAKY